MFKKKIKINSQNKLKKSDNKKIIEFILKNFSISLQDLENLIGNGKECIFSILRLSNSNTLIYSMKEQPLFFDLEGKGELCPTSFF